MRAYLVKSEADFTNLAMKRYLEELEFEKEIQKQSVNSKKGSGRGRGKNLSGHDRSSLDSGFQASREGSSSGGSSFFGKDNSWSTAEAVKKQKSL